MAVYPHSAGFRRFLRLNQWQLLAPTLLAVTLSYLGEHPLAWWQLTLFTGITVLGWLWYRGVIAYSQRLLGTLHGKDKAPWDRLLILHMLCIWGMTLAQWLSLSAPMEGLPLVWLAGLPPYMFGYPRLGHLLSSLQLLASLAYGTMLLLWLSQHPNSGGTAPFLEGLLLIPTFLLLWQFGRLASGIYKQEQLQIEHLQSLATTDGLTGLINRRQFNSRLMEEMARARRHQKALAMALFDIDNFKHINDYYGHPTGDHILRELSAIVLRNVRESDIVARYGGEEFALILPETRRLEAYELLERIRAIVEQHVFCMPENPISLSISVGVTQFDWHRHTSLDFIEEADKALYQAKNEGKNQVIIYGMGKMNPKLLGRPLTM